MTRPHVLLLRQLVLVCGLILPLTAHARECDQQIDARFSESKFRKAVAEKLLCEVERQRPGYLEAVIELTEYYFENSTNPSCEILVANANAHIELAQQLQEKTVLSADERDELENHWRDAWDMLSGISYAWIQSTGAEELPGDDGSSGKAKSASKQAAMNDAAFDRCVRPARELLGEYPSVTITVEPEDIDGYELRWNGTRRTASLPRIMPADHHRLDIVPPRGYKTTVTIDGKLKKNAIEGEVTVYPSASYHDPVPIHQIRIKFMPLVVDDKPLAPGAAPPEEDDEGDGDGKSVFHPTWFWTGVGLSVAGGIGLGVSLANASTHEDRGNRLYDPAVCNPVTPACPQDDILDAYDSADAWRMWGGGISGVVLGAGVISIVTSFFVSPDDDEQPRKTDEEDGEDDDWDSGMIYPLLAPNAAGIGVFGRF